jgi:hypothetical protein
MDFAIMMVVTIFIEIAEFSYIQESKSDLSGRVQNFINNLERING